MGAPSMIPTDTAATVSMSGVAFLPTNFFALAHSIASARAT